MSGIWHAEDESHTLLLDMQPSSILRYKETVKPFKGETCEVYCIFTGSFTMPDGHKFSIRQSYGSVKLASES